MLPSEKPIFIKRSRTISSQYNNNDKGNNNNTKEELNNLIEEEETYFLKRLPIRVGNFCIYRHLVATRISSAASLNLKNKQSKLITKRYILTFGYFEVTEILGFNSASDTIYYIATSEKRPGHRHLYQLKIHFNSSNGTAEKHFLLLAGNPVCLTCSHHEDDLSEGSVLVKNDLEYYKANFLQKIKETTNRNPFHGKVPISKPTNERPSEENVTAVYNCLYNRIHLSPQFGYYFQECLGPNVPATFVVDLRTNTKQLIWDDGADLFQKISAVAFPSIKKFSVLTKYGFEAQVKLYLPPNLNEEDDDIAYPLILHV